MITIEDGTGLADANSYIDPTGTVALDLLAGHFYTATWDAFNSTQKEKLVRMATRLLDQNMLWNGFRKLTTQALDWPRENVVVECRAVTGLPLAVAQATLLQAMAMGERNRAADPGSGGDQGVKSLGLGDGALEIEFESDPAAGQPLSVLTQEVTTMLRDYGQDIGSNGRGSVRRVYRG